MFKTPAYAAPSANAPLGPLTVERREPGPHDVLIDILFCGICHSDIHQVRDEWGGSIFPMVPGHEIVGPRDRPSGAEVKRFKVGDLVGVGCMVDSCRTCASCQTRPRAVLREGRRLHLQRHRDGPEDADLRRLLHRRSWSTRPSSSRSPRASTSPAPRRCSAPGITTYSPLRHWKLQEGRPGGRGGPGRPGPHGGEARRRHGRRGDHAQHLEGQGGRRPHASAPPASPSPPTRPPSRSWRATSTSSSTPSPRPTTTTRTSGLLRLDGRHGAGGRARPSPPRCHAFSLIVGRKTPRPAPSSAASPRPRRCSTSAASTASSPTIEIIPVAEDQRGLRAHAQGRRALPLRHRLREPEDGLRPRRQTSSAHFP